MRRQDKKISLLINSLTNNEDHRQDLWVMYLTGTSSSLLKQKLSQIEQENKFYNKLQIAAWKMHKSLPSDQFFYFLSNFTDFEQSVMLLLLLDLSVEEVAEYKGISPVRVKQAITVIKNNKIWEKIWLSKETLLKKKNTD